MSERIYRDAAGKIPPLRKKDINFLIERYKDPLFRRNVGEHTAKAIDLCVIADLEYLLRGGRIA